MPKKTFTAFEPLTLPIELSAYLSCSAATFDAKVSEREWNSRSTNDTRRGNYPVMMFPRPRKQSPSLYLSDPPYSQTSVRNNNDTSLVDRSSSSSQLTCVAKSPINAVSIPMITIETTKHNHPPPIPNQAVRREGFFLSSIFSYWSGERKQRETSKRTR